MMIDSHVDCGKVITKSDTDEIYDKERIQKEYEGRRSDKDRCFQRGCCQGTCDVSYCVVIKTPAMCCFIYLYLVNT